MKKLICLLEVFCLLMLLLSATACDESEKDSKEEDSVSGTYAAQFSFEFELSKKFEITLTASLTLDKDGGYAFECTQLYDFYPCYVEEGSYTLEGEEITLIPSACQKYADSSWSMKELTADEQASMTTKGTLKDDVFAANMRWNDSLWDQVTTDMQLKRVVKSYEPAASIAHEIAKGVYEGEATLGLQFGPTDGPSVSKTSDIRAKLVLNQSGTYTYACAYAKEYRNMTYCEEGTYTLAGDEITLIPTKAMFKIYGGAGELQELTADQQASMTTIGTLKDNTFSAKMRWLFPYHQLTGDVQLTRTSEQ